MVECTDDAPANASAEVEEVEVSWVDGDWEEAAACEWDCDQGFGEVEGECLSSIMVECSDEAPANATSEIEDVEVMWTGDGWEDAAACEWSCDSEYGQVGEQCQDSQMVACLDESPANASAHDEDVEVMWTGDGWEDAAACEWSCDAGYGQVGEQCQSSQWVQCVDDAPANAASIIADVQTSWTGDGFSEPATCAWECIQGYGEVEGECVSSMMVQCADESPENATAVEQDVQVTWTGDGFSEPPACNWSCDAGYGEVDGQCLESMMVQCVDESPANATAIDADVEVEWTGDGFSEPAACDWTCNEGFGEFEGACEESIVVECVDEAPENATAEVVEVSVDWAGEDWEDAPACNWSCDAGYGEVEGECLESMMVQCADVAPDGATSEIIDVEVEWTGDGFSDPAECEWSCDEGNHAEGDGCVPNVAIDWCVTDWPAWVQTPITSEVHEPTLEYRGVVYSEDGTAGEGRLEGVTALVCHSYDPLISPLSLGHFDCIEASYSGDVDGLSAGDLSNDEYQAAPGYAYIGEASYLFAFSGDGGEDWTFCDLDGPAGDEDPVVPGGVSVFGPINGGMEHWDEEDTLPIGYTAANGVGVERETAVVRSGDSAVRLTRVIDDNGATEFSTELQPIIPGRTYAIDMWFFDESEDVRGRHIYQWFDADGESLAAPSYGAFTSVSQEWQLLSRTVTAPEDAHFVRVATRIHDEVWESVVLDDILIIEVGE